MAVSTEIEEQYRRLKQEADGCLLPMQVGVFMQVMDQDARTIAGVTGLKLNMAGEVDRPVVVGGFPKSGLDAYVGRLVRAGHSVAIALQAENKERRLTEVIRVDSTKCGAHDAARGDARPPGGHVGGELEGERPASRDEGGNDGAV